MKPQTYTKICINLKMVSPVVVLSLQLQIRKHLEWVMKVIQSTSTNKWVVERKGHKTGYLIL